MGVANGKRKRQPVGWRVAWLDECRAAYTRPIPRSPTRATPDATVTPIRTPANRSIIAVSSLRCFARGITSGKGERVQWGSSPESVTKAPSALCERGTYPRAVRDGVDALEARSSCFGAIRVHRPDLPVVVMSGVVPDGRVGAALEHYGAPLSTKPFSPHALSWVIRETLESARHEFVPQAREVRAQSMQTRADSIQIRAQSAGLRADARELLATARAVQAQLFGGAPEVRSA